MASRRPDVPKQGALPAELRMFLEHSVIRFDTSHRIERSA
jgi:hypothetical protein